ncbi:MAG: hypothetical protein NUV67_02745 [archaeon]|nr:hypothetical protein [archaeon]
MISEVVCLRFWPQSRMFFSKVSSNFSKIIGRKKSDWHNPTVFDAVDIGSGSAKQFLQNPHSFPKGKYVAVDPLYSLPAMPIKKIVKQIGKSGGLVKDSKLSDFVKEMIGQGHRAKSFVCHMPSLPIEMYDFEFLFKNARRVLAPGGNISVTSEMTDELERISQLARKHGLNPQPIELFSGVKTSDMESTLENKKIFHLNIGIK